MFAAPAGAAEPTTPAHIVGIEARLWYQHSGRLSRNLLAGKEPFVGWNTIIGEGPVEEPATDLLVDVKVAGREDDLVPQPLDLWVTNAAGKTVARRKVEGMLLPLDGALHNALWLPDVGCAGKLTIHARLGKQVKTSALALDCGE